MKNTDNKPTTLAELRDELHKNENIIVTSVEGEEELERLIYIPIGAMDDGLETDPLAYVCASLNHKTKGQISSSHIGDRQALSIIEKHYLRTVA